MKNIEYRKICTCIFLYVTAVLFFIVITFSCSAKGDNNERSIDKIDDDHYDYAAFLRFKEMHDKYSNNEEEEQIIDYEIKDDDNAFLWLNRYRRSWEDSSFDGNETIGFSIIPDNYKNEYISYLENTSYIVLEKDDYFKLTQINLTKRYGIAVRAVHVQLGGQFILCKNRNNEYLVNYIAMGSRVWQRGKTVLLFETDELPNDIYVQNTVIR